jgi:hypothetical protein
MDTSQRIEASFNKQRAESVNENQRSKTIAGGSVAVHSPAGAHLVSILIEIQCLTTWKRVILQECRTHKSHSVHTFGYNYTVGGWKVWPIILLQQE